MKDFIQHVFDETAKSIDELARLLTEIKANTPKNRFKKYRRKMRQNRRMSKLYKIKS